MANDEEVLAARRAQAKADLEAKRALHEQRTAERVASSPAREAEADARPRREPPPAVTLYVFRISSIGGEQLDVRQTHIAAANMEQAVDQWKRTAAEGEMLGQAERLYVLDAIVR